MKFLLLLLIIFISLHPIFSETADDFLNKAEELVKKGDYITAETTFLSAEKIRPEEGFYTARRAQFYFFTLKDYQKAIDTHLIAYQKGFRGYWLFSQIGQAYQKTGNHQEAEKWFKNGIINASEKVKKAKAEDINRYQNELINAYGLLADYYLSMDDFENSIKNAAFGYQQDPKTDNFRLIFAYTRSLYLSSLIEFGNGNWEKSIKIMELCQKIIENNPAVKDKYYPLESILKIMKKRNRIGNKLPAYTHKLSVIILSETDCVIRENNNNISITGKVTRRQKQYLEWSVNFLKQFIEALTAGDLSITAETIKADLKLSALTSNSEETEDDKKLRHPDLERLTADYEDIFTPLLENTDTLLFIWSSVDYNIANGGSHKFILPLAKKVYNRGYMQIPAERIEWNGPTLLLHEFFHVVENITGIRPRHGMYPENRQAFPEWKGKDEIDYYDWQFSYYIPEKIYAGKNDYKSFNFSTKYPARTIPKD